MKSQFRKVVIGIDFSDASLSGARWVATHLAPRAELLLVHVVPLPEPPSYLLEYMPQTIDHRATLVPRLYNALRAFADLLGLDGVRVGVRTGVPWSALARVAREVKADLICVGRGQRRPGTSRFGATTPQRLLGVSEVPVLVIPQGAVAKPERVLAALSGRPGGERVIPAAKYFADHWAARLDAIHVIETDVHQTALTPATQGIGRFPDTRSLAPLRPIGIDALDQGTLERLAAQWVKSAFSGPGPTSSRDPVIRAGDPGQELIAASLEQHESSLMVIGRLGESASKRPWVGEYRCGSTARMVLWAAPGPVLVIPTELDAPRLPAFSARQSEFDELQQLRPASANHMAVRSTSNWYHRNGDDAA